jgi:hypothetical protein
MPAGPSLTWELPAAAFGHALLFAIVTIARCGSGGEEPLFKPQETIQVALSGAPKNVTRMPQKAERAPDAFRAPSTDVKAPPPTPTNSDMAFQTPDAPKTKGDPNAEARQKAMDELRRRQALRDLTAPLGDEDRLASNPEGVEGGSGANASAGVNDPALARWAERAKQQISANWHPLQRDPNLVVVLLIEVEASGRQSAAPKVRKSSGSVSFDETARRAAETTPNLGRLPEKFPDGLAVELTFTLRDAL